MSHHASDASENNKPTISLTPLTHVHCVDWMNYKHILSQNITFITQTQKLRWIEIFRDHVLDVVNSRNRLLRHFLLRPYIDLPNFVDHLTRKPYAYTTRCKCKITRFNLASRETGIKRFRAWTHRWVRSQPAAYRGWRRRTPGTNVLEKSPKRRPPKWVSNGRSGL